FFSCTSCTDETAFSVRIGTGVSPPSTHLVVLNSVFGVGYSTQGATMLALNNWPLRAPGPENRVPENLTCNWDSFAARGWKSLIQADAGAQFSVADASRWSEFWGDAAGTGFDVQATPFSPAGDPTSAEPTQFKSDVSSSGNGGEYGKPGC